ELEGLGHLFDMGIDPKTSERMTASQRWARLLGISQEEYDAKTEKQRREARHALTRKALEDERAKKEQKEPYVTIFGVIGPGLEKDEREALIEYVKSL